MTRYVSAQGDVPAARLELVFLLERVGRIDDARCGLDRVPGDILTSGDRMFIAGALDTMSGNFERALDELGAAAQAKPDAGQVWLALAMVADMSAHPDLADRIVAADPEKTGRAMEQRGSYYYALGKVHADRTGHPLALAAFQRGAAEIGKTASYDRAAEAEGVRRIVEGFDRVLVDRLSAAVKRPTSRAIIVTGNPRSGTTLASQILTAHSNVAAGDELALMRIVASDTGGMFPDDVTRWLDAGGSADDLAALYLHLIDERFGPDGRIVDKTLGASRTLGVLAGILPQAPLVWLRRRPLDCAWSCFRTHFAQGNPWSWSFDTIAHHFDLEDHLLAHWQRVLGDRLLVVDYEELATTPDTMIPALLDHCNLPPESGPLAPETASTVVRTASVAQVRRPISRAGIGVAAPYRDAMKGFIDNYAG